MNKKIVLILAVLLGFAIVTPQINIGYCSDGFDFSEIMTMFADIMPLIIYLAMIGAVMGIIAGVTKKMGKW